MKVTSLWDISVYYKLTVTGCQVTDDETIAAKLVTLYVSQSN